MAIDLARDGITRADRDMRAGREAYGLEGDVDISLIGATMALDRLRRSGAYAPSPHPTLQLHHQGL